MFTREQSKKSGAILVMVLLSTALLGGVALHVASKLRQEIHLQGYGSQNFDLKSTAYQVMDLSFAVLHEFQFIQGGLYSPAQGWGDIKDHLKLGAGFSETSIGGAEYQNISLIEGVEVDIKLSDETGKIPLQSVTEEMLEIYFEETGFSPVEVDLLKDSLMDWLDSDDERRDSGAENLYYGSLDPPYITANGILVNEKELLWVRGFREFFFDEYGVPNEEYFKFWDSFSLESHSRVNLNTANSAVLAVLSEVQGFDATQLEQFFAGDDGVRNTEDDGILWPNLESDEFPLNDSGELNEYRTRSQVINLQVTVRSGGTDFHLFSKIQWQGESNSAMKILELVENISFINQGIAQSNTADHGDEILTEDVDFVQGMGGF